MRDRREFIKSLLYLSSGFFVFNSCTKSEFDFNQMTKSDFHEHILYDLKLRKKIYLTADVNSQKSIPSNNPSTLFKSRKKVDNNIEIVGYITLASLVNEFTKNNIKTKPINDDLYIIYFKHPKKFEYNPLKRNRIILIKESEL